MLKVIVCKFMQHFVGVVEYSLVVGIALHVQYRHSVFAVRISLGLLDMEHPR